MVDEHVERGQDVLDGLDRGRGVLVPAQVDHDPGHVPQEGDGDLGVDEAEERLDDAEADDVVPEVGAVADDVAERPHGLLAHILVLAGQQLQEQGHGVGLHHGVCLGKRKKVGSLGFFSLYSLANRESGRAAVSVYLLGRSGRNVGERPSGLKLEAGVVGGAEAVHQDREDAGMDQSVDRRVAVGAQKFPGRLK